MMTALLTGVVIPWGGELTLFGGDLQPAGHGSGDRQSCTSSPLQASVFTASCSGGWASNNKFALLGAVRAASQMVSYELGLGLSIVALVMLTGTLSLGGIVDYQIENGWNVIYQPLGFIIFSCAPSRKRTGRPSTCPSARPNWWAATTPSSAA
jgi:NADH-quinone oxidoreductase subunit H